MREIDRQERVLASWLERLCESDGLAWGPARDSPGDGPGSRSGGAATTLIGCSWVRCPCSSTNRGLASPDLPGSRTLVLVTGPRDSSWRRRDNRSRDLQLRWTDSRFPFRVKSGGTRFITPGQAGDDHSCGSKSTTASATASDPVGVANAALGRDAETPELVDAVV